VRGSGSVPSLRSPHDREIARLAVPAFGALVAEPLYVLADTAIVGRLGTEELAGVAVASSGLLTFYAVFIFLAYGTTAAVSRLLGAGREREAAHQAVQGLWLATVIGVAVTAVVLALAGPIVGLLGGTGEVRDHALTYLRISALGVTFQLLTFAGTGYLRGLQDTRTPLVVAVGAAAVNLVLEVLLIPVLDFGVGASAASTVVAQVGAALVYVRLIGGATSTLGASPAPDWPAIRRLGRAGWDLLVRTVALRASLTLATALAARIGAAEVGAHEVAFAVWSFLALGLDAIAIAGQAIVGRHLGADDPVVARDVGRRMLQLGTGAGVVVGALVLLARPWLPQVFSEDPEVVSLAGFLLVLVAVLQPVNGAVFVLDGLLIGAGDLAFLARAMVGAALATAPVGVAVAVFDLGIGWVWGAIAVLMATRLAALALRWRTGAWAVGGAVR